MNSQDNNVFWLEKPMILINSFNKFIPTRNMSTIQQMNAITLFCVYALILLKVVDLDNKFTTALFIGIIIILIFIYINRYKTQKTQENMTQKSILKKKLDNNDDDDDSFYNKINVDNTKDAANINYGKKSKRVNFVKDISVESGYYNSDDILQLGEFKSEKNRNTELDEMVAKTSLNNQHLLNQNREPTIDPTADNPFVNPLLSDFNTDAFPYAGNADDDELKDKINLTYNKDLFRDLTDVFDIKNAERQFYTVPGGAIPNDQNKFAQWCYNTPSTCKEDTRQCNLIPTDIRYINNYK
jgi:hypothetical protein